MTIAFYGQKNEHAWLSNFSPHAFTLDERIWPTVEHHFQAGKFPETDHAERIWRARTPKDAKALGRSRVETLRSDWEAVKEDVMRRALRAKFAAHPDLAARLKATGEDDLVEQSPYDYYWGCGRTGTGQNRLGHLLMELRTALIAETRERNV